MTSTWILWTVLALVAVLVGLAKTMLPGLGVLAAAVIATVMPAKESTGALLVMLLTGDLVAIVSYRHDADFALLRRMMPMVLVGLGLGGIYFHLASDGATKKLIGVILLVMVALTVWQRRRPRDEAANVRATARASGPLRRAGFGSLAGFTTMVANAGGPVTSLYFLSVGHEVARFLGTTAWFFFVVNVIKLPISITSGAIQWHSAAHSLVLIPVVIGSALLGRRWALRIPQLLFERIVLVLTAISSAWLLV